MAVFSAVDPVVVGIATKADHYHRVFDNTVAIQEGSVALAKVALDGTGTPPAVSAAGDALIYYDTTENSLRVSTNAGAFDDLGSTFMPGDPVLLAYGMGW